MRLLAIALALASLSVAAACDGGTERKKVDRPAVELGERLFRDPDLSPSGNNYLACNDCHSASADEGERIHPGYPLENAANRDAWWGGYESQFLDAVNFCLTFFMRGQPLTPGDPDGDALYEYLDSISPAPAAPALPLTLTKTIPLLGGGDADAGRDVYDAACRGCHGSRSGSGRLHSSVTALDDDLWADYDVVFPGVDHRLIVAEKVRHGAFFGIGGVMPPFAEERLTDEQLADILAYLGL